MSPPGRVLLTGAGGFVGRRVAADLVEAGWQVRAPLRRAAEGLPPQVQIMAMGDLAAPQDWTGALEGVDAIVHAAAIAHTGGIDEGLYDAVNTRATLDLASAAAAGRVRRFVFLSSVRAQSGPTAPRPLDEGQPPQPTDAYGRSKLAAEQGLARLAGLSSVALRPVVVYGPGARGNVGALERLARLPVPLPFAALRAPRSFLSLENLSAAVRLALAEPALTGPVLVADPVPSSLAEFVAAMRRARGRAPGLVDLPLGALARMAGRGEAWERIAGALEVRPARLLGAGWSPPVASTPEGVARWLRTRPHA